VGQPISASGSIPAKGMGMGLNEAPRGALGHWIDMADGKIANYQMVVPSTWNLGPRCAAGKRGPVEQALVGTKVADPQRPIEVLRIVHSYDPCLACAVHVIDKKRDREYKVDVV
jgi:[NiFe] hydrogenase large subunit